MHKREELCSVLEDSNSDIAMLTETWLKPDVRDDELFPDHLNLCIYRKDRPLQRGGGVLIGVKRHITSFCIQLQCSLEITCVCLCSAIIKTVLVVCYRPPKSDSAFTSELHKVLLEITERFPKANLLLFGDFNFPDVSWSSLTADASRDSREFLELCLLFNLTQVVLSPTRGDNILDLVLTSSPDLV